MAAGIPVVGKRKEEDPCQPCAKRDLDVAAEDLRLRFLTLTHRVDAKLGEQQRPVPGNALQAIEIIGERARFVEVDIETDEIDAGRLQEFGRGEINEGYQPLWIDFLD